VVSKRILTWAIALVAFLAADQAQAQAISVDLGGDGSLSLRTIQLFVLVTLLSLAPGMAIMLTCFPFMVTVLSILRQAIGVQQAPPNMMIVSLALFLTYFVMEPVFMAAWREGISPLIDDVIEPDQAFARTLAPFQTFMISRVDPITVETLVSARGQPLPTSMETVPLSTLIPSFLLSEIQRGFEVGFLVFLPFLIIDLVVAAILMSMGMMMVPPAVVCSHFSSLQMAGHFWQAHW